MKLFKFLFTISIGALYGMLFAQKPGRELREELKKSDEPLKTLLKEGVALDMEALNLVTKEIKSSEEIKAVLKKMETYVHDLGLQAENLGKEGIAQAQKEMETLAYSAKKIADELKIKFEQAKTEAQKEIKNVLYQDDKDK